MYTVMVILDVILAAALIGLILIQHGKGADAGAAFGSGSSGTVFGAAGGASVIQKITGWIAVAFFVVTLGLSMMAKDRVSTTVQEVKPTSVMQGEAVPAAEIQTETAAGFVPEGATQQDPVEAIPEGDQPEIRLPEIPAVPEAAPATDSSVIPE